MYEQIYEAISLMDGFILASLIVLVVGAGLQVIWVMRTGRFGWAGFVLTMFLAVLLYDLGIWELTDRSEPWFLQLFHALQIMSANKDFSLSDVTGASEEQLRVLEAYGTALFIVAPVSIVTAVFEYFSGALTSLMLWLTSLMADSYIFSQLDERTLDFAEGVRAHYRKKWWVPSRSVCIVFADCGNANDELLAAAHKMKALCLDGGVTKAWHRCSRLSPMPCSIVLFEEDEAAAIATACKIKEKAQSGLLRFLRRETRIFVLTDFRTTESLLFPELLKTEGKWNKRRGKVVVRGIDLTRELVEQVMLQYPIFLLSKPHEAKGNDDQHMLQYPIFLLSKLLPGVGMPSPEDSGHEDVGVPPASCWYHADTHKIAEARRLELYERPDRHILVIGAGSVGTEFLSSALWASRIDGMQFKIDVVDSAEDPLNPGKPLVEARYTAEAPEIMSHRVGVLGVAEEGAAKAEEGEAKTGVSGTAEESGTSTDEGEVQNVVSNIESGLYDLTFSLVDAEADSYAHFLAARAKTLSYVFIALGDDMLNARVAMRTRQILERELAVRVKSRDEFLRASRPLIVAVIRNDEFAATVKKAVNEGQPYDIVCVGNNSDVLTHKMLEGVVGNRDTEYKRRSNRAGNTHVKYRMFAFARNLLLDRRDVRAAFKVRPNDECFQVLKDTLGLNPSSKSMTKLRNKVFDESFDDTEIIKTLGGVDWTADVYDYQAPRYVNGEEVKDWPPVSSQAKSWVLALMYQLYCTDRFTRALDSKESPLPSREWLLRMEHDRWNAYVRTQGFARADYDATEHVFATGQADEQKHRSNLMGLHPCLAPFKDLAGLDAPLYHLYKRYFNELKAHEIGVAEADKEKRLHTAETDWLQLLDDKYIGIKEAEN